MGPEAHPQQPWRMEPDKVVAGVCTGAGVLGFGGVLANLGFAETQHPSLVYPTLGNMDPAAKDVCAWERASSQMAPSYYSKHYPPGSPVDIPRNAYGYQNLDDQYVGLVARRPTDAYREYITTPIWGGGTAAAPLGEGWYYVAMWVSLGSYSTTASAGIGVCLTSVKPTDAWFGPTGNGRMRILQDATGGTPQLYSSAPDAVSVPLLNERYLTDTAGFVKIAGCFYVPAGEEYTYATIGDFNPDGPGNTLPATPAPAPAANPALANDVYYYIAAAGIHPFTGPGIDYTINCGETVRLGDDDIHATWPMPFYSNARYSWTGTDGLGPTNKATQRLDVTPSGTTRYTLTVTVPPNGGGIGPSTVVQTGSITVTVRPNPECASRCGTGIVDLTGQSFTGGHTFTGYTRYQSDTDLLLEHGTYTFEPHSMLLMGPNANIIVGDGATLDCPDAVTITAACDEMWGGILMRGTSKGVRLGWSELSHSLDGIVVHDGVEEGVTNARLFDVFNSRFLHNRYSFTDLRGPLGPATSSDFVTDNVFRSAPQVFKKPMRALGQIDYAYSKAHIRLAGDFQQANFVYNRFGRALVGLHLAGAQLPSLEGCAFDSCYLAGVFVGDQNTNLALVTQVTVTLPPDATFPATTQVSDMLAEAAYAPLRPHETVGIYAGPGTISVTNSTFSQPTTAGHTTYPYTATRYRQIGIRSLGTSASTYEQNTFEDLHTGIELSGMAGFETELTNNAFRNCEVGLWLGQPASQLGQSSNVYTQCNTFARTRVTTGTSYGIYAAAGAVTTISDWRNRNSVRAPLNGELRNAFAEALSGGTRQMYDVYNDPGNTSLVYRTFRDLVPGLRASGNISLPLTNIVTQPTGAPVLDDCGADGWANGEQWRPALPSGNANRPREQPKRLEIAPNPTDGPIEVRYNLEGYDSGSSIALYVTEPLTGTTVYTTLLHSTTDRAALTLPRAGLYQCRLMVDGRPVGKAQLVIRQ